MADMPSTHYVKCDDVHIAYQVIGEGPFDLMFVPGFVSNVEAMWQSPDRSVFFRRLASFSRVIVFDKRGTGMSDRGSQIFTLEQRMQDMQTVLNKVGSERAALFGMSEGGPMSLLYAATYPERTSALVLYGAYAKRAWSADYTFGWKEDRWKQVLDNIENHWGTPRGMSVTMWAPSIAHDHHAAERLASYFRASASPGAAAAIMKMNREIDVRHILQFLTGRRHAHEPDRVLATVLFADIVDSTAQAAALGDSSWRELRNAFYARVRRVLEQYRGREINTSGDGFLATFDGPARAVRCATAIRDAVRSLNLEVRCGLHTGECELVGNDIAGIAVHTGARVAALAAPGEVLVSQTVRDLVAGSGLTFEEVGTYRLKGVPNEWHLFRAIAS